MKVLDDYHASLVAPKQDVPAKKYAAPALALVRQFDRNTALMAYIKKNGVPADIQKCIALVREFDRHEFAEYLSGGEDEEEEEEEEEVIAQSTKIVPNRYNVPIGIALFTMGFIFANLLWIILT